MGKEEKEKCPRRASNGGTTQGATNLSRSATSGNSGGGTRTRDVPVMSRMFYQLNYPASRWKEGHPPLGWGAPEGERNQG